MNQNDLAYSKEQKGKPFGPVSLPFLFSILFFLFFLLFPFLDINWDSTALIDMKFSASAFKEFTLWSKGVGGVHK